MARLFFLSPAGLISGGWGFSGCRFPPFLWYDDVCSFQARENVGGQFKKNRGGVGMMKIEWAYFRKG